MRESPVGPILVLGTGHRCGSTLLQRLLSSHPDVLIWGEHLGQLSALLDLGTTLREWSGSLGARARNLFDQGGYQSFMANLTPEQDRIDEAIRAFVRTLFAEPAAALGRPVWGLKEVRYARPEAAELHRLFPGLAVVFLVRDPRDILRSLDEWERGGGWWHREQTEYAIVSWLRVAESFLPGDDDPLPVLRLRYEDVVADPAGAATLIGKHTGLDPARFDPEVFARRIPGGPAQDGSRVLRDWDDLPAAMRSLVTPDVRRVAAAYGYDS